MFVFNVLKALGNWRFFIRYTVTKLQFPYLRHIFRKSKNQRGVLQIKIFCREIDQIKFCIEFQALQNALQKNNFVASCS